MTSQIYFAFWEITSRVWGRLNFSNQIISLDFTTEKVKKRALLGSPAKPEMM